MPVVGAVVERLLRCAKRVIPSDTFGRQVAVVGGGAALVQVMGILASPVLTRLYAPADFGVMAAFSALSEILVLAATLRFEAAIPIANNDDDAAHLLVAAAASAVAFSVGVLLLSLTLPRSVFVFLSPDPAFYAFRSFLVVAVAGGSSYACLVAWATRKQEFEILTRSKAYQSTTSLGVQISMGVVSGGVLGLLLGAVANLTSGVWMLLRQAIQDLRQSAVSIRRAQVCRVAWEFRAYPMFTIWTSLLNLFGRSMPTIVLSSAHGAEAAGHFGLGMRVVGLPSALLSAAVSSVFLSRVSEASRTGRLRAEVEDVVTRLSGPAALVFSVVGFFGPDLFGLIFGTRWMNAGAYVRWLSPWLFLAFVFSPQTSLVLVRERQALDALLQVPIVSLRLGALYLGTQWGGTLGAIALFGVTAAVTAFFYFGWVLSLGGVSFARILRVLGGDLLASISLLAMCRWLFLSTGRSPIVMILLVSLATELLRRRFWRVWKRDSVV